MKGRWGQSFEERGQEPGTIEPETVVRGKRAGFRDISVCLDIK